MVKNLPIVPSAQAGSMAESPSGLIWKEQYPVVGDACNLCLECTLFCPEGAITAGAGAQKVSIDLQLCKGCGICAAECHRKVIALKPEYSGERGIFPAKEGKS